MNHRSSGSLITLFLPLIAGCSSVVCTIPVEEDIHRKSQTDRAHIEWSVTSIANDAEPLIGRRVTVHTKDGRQKLYLDGYENETVRFSREPGVAAEFAGDEHGEVNLNIRNITRIDAQASVTDLMIGESTASFIEPARDRHTTISRGSLVAVSFTSRSRGALEGFVGGVVVGGIIATISIMDGDAFPADAAFVGSLPVVLGVIVGSASGHQYRYIFDRE